MTAFILFKNQTLTMGKLSDIELVSIKIGPL